MNFYKAFGQDFSTFYEVRY